MTRRLALALGALVVLLDHWTKLCIRRRVDFSTEISVIPGWLSIIHTENPGAAFGMLAEGSPLLRHIILVGISGAVLTFVLSAILRKNSFANTAAARTGLALVLGGAAGNLYDRVLRGTVTDFVEFFHGAWSFPAFNVADSAITIGAALLVIDMLRPAKQKVPHVS